MIQLGEKKDMTHTHLCVYVGALSVTFTSTINISTINTCWLVFNASIIYFYNKIALQRRNKI